MKGAFLPFPLGRAVATFLGGVRAPMTGGVNSQAAHARFKCFLITITSSASLCGCWGSLASWR